jgi:carbonic anhydrase
MFSVSYLVLSTILLNAHLSQESSSVRDWGYMNENSIVLPPYWYQKYPKCNGTRQSPIDIFSTGTLFNTTLGQININQQRPVDNSEERWEIKNNGFSVLITPLNHAFTYLKMPDNVTFKLLQMHFHWRGSEHFIDGHKFAAELHLVHQSQKDPNQFAVLGFLFDTAQTNNVFLSPINKVIRNISVSDSAVNVTNFRLRNLLPFSINNYFRYSGSLTTPGCDEVKISSLENNHK